MTKQTDHPNLEDFIREALLQIVRGVAAAQLDEAIHQTGAQIVPTSPGTFDDHHSTRQIEFDVVVSTQAGTQTKGGVGVFVGAVGLGSQGQSNHAADSANRIRFSVPVSLPQQPKKNKD